MLPLPLLAQEYRWQAQVQNVPEEDYYRIAIPPVAISRLQPGLDDLRIVDAKGREIPYVLQTEETVTQDNIFVPLRKITSEVLPNCCSNYTIAIPDSINANGWTLYPPLSAVANEKGISSLILKIKNADINKKLALSGSDDRIKWFGIKQDYLLSSPFSTSAPYAYKIIEFPLSNYRYLRLEINDSSSKPVQVLAIGVFNSAEKQASYVEVPAQNIAVEETVKEGESVTYYSLKFDEPQQIERIAINATADAGFYLRHASLEYGFKSANDTSIQFKEIMPLVLISDETGEWELPPSTSRYFRLKIYNENNYPLQFGKVKLFQRKRYLLARLQPQMKYRLVFGNEKAKTPKYDLRFFTEQLPEYTAIITTDSISVIPKDSEAAEEDLPLIHSRWFLWVAILLVAGLLGFMSLHMLREMKKR